MKKVTYFDVEWANSTNKSICQMGILCEDFETDETIYEKNHYINPEDDFDFQCVAKHNITQRKVADEQTFPQVWKEVEQYFCDSIIIGYNVAGADLDALTKCLQRYNLDIPKFYYIDIMDIVKAKISKDTVVNYKMKTLLDYYGIDIDREHDAFTDACAIKDLLLALQKSFKINLDKYIYEYSVQNDFIFEPYISDPNLRRAVCEIYGIIQGISLDNHLSDAELQFVTKWKKDNAGLVNSEKIIPIMDVVDTIIDDGAITKNDLTILHRTIADYVHAISASTTTLAIQVLYGILKGIACDKVIETNECENLRAWLSQYGYLKGNYPFDDISASLEKILEDNIVTANENEALLNLIATMLDPIRELKSQIYNVKGRKVCLTGDFAYGRKDSVAKYIEERGGIVVNSVTKSLDILLIGNLGSDEYAYAAFGTKVKKALEYKKRYSVDIVLVTEEDFFSTIK